MKHQSQDLKWVLKWKQLTVVNNISKHRYYMIGIRLNFCLDYKNLRRLELFKICQTLCRFELWLIVFLFSFCLVRNKTLTWSGVSFFLLICMTSQIIESVITRHHINTETTTKWRYLTLSRRWSHVIYPTSTYGNFQKCFFVVFQKILPSLEAMPKT